MNIQAHRDWDRPPKYCSNCKQKYYEVSDNCSHCGKSYAISTGMQIKCKESGWSLPKRCEDCRELFRHKPFKTVPEKTLFGSVVFRTYNSIGQLISESRNETGFFGDKKRVHRSHTGKKSGESRKRSDWFGNKFVETKGLDGRIKSTSHELTGIFGDKYTESTGGDSGTKHRTRAKTSWTGKKYRETQ